MHNAKAECLEFWEAFIEHLQAIGSPIRRRKPQPQHWYDVAIGKSGVHLSLTIRLRNGDLGCELYLKTENAKELFHALRRDRKAIESDLGELEWIELPNNKASRIVVRAPYDISDRTVWPKAHIWLDSQAQGFKSCFAPRVKRLIEVGTSPEPERPEG